MKKTSFATGLLTTAGYCLGPVVAYYEARLLAYRLGIDVMLKCE